MAEKTTDTTNSNNTNLANGPMVFDSLFSKKWQMADEFSTEDEPLKAISIPAILAFLGGLLSFLLFMSTYFFFVPILALMLAIIALIRIRVSSGNQIGEGLALAAIGLLVIPSIAVPIKDAIYKDRFVRDAQRFAAIWFETMASGNIFRVKQLNHVPHCVDSTMSEVNYWRQFLGDEMTHEELHTFLADPLLLTLEALGHKAKATYYKTEAVRLGSESEEILMTYAITYPNQANQPETFFVQINANRSPDAKRKIGLWKGGDRIKGPLKVNAAGLPVME